MRNQRVTSIFTLKSSLNQVRSDVRAGMPRVMTKARQARSSRENPSLRVLGKKRGGQRRIRWAEGDDFHGGSSQTLKNAKGIVPVHHDDRRPQPESPPRGTLHIDLKAPVHDPSPGKGRPERQTHTPQSFFGTLLPPGWTKGIKEDILKRTHLRVGRRENADKKRG